MIMIIKKERLLYRNILYKVLYRNGVRYSKGGLSFTQIEYDKWL